MVAPVSLTLALAPIVWVIAKSCFEPSRVVIDIPADPLNNELTEITFPPAISEWHSPDIDTATLLPSNKLHIELKEGRASGWITAFHIVKEPQRDWYYLRYYVDHTGLVKYEKLK